MTKILLADDDLELCDLLIEYLSSEGFTVSTTHDGEAAVHKAIQQQYDLIILDIMMPKMDGLLALSKMRKQIATPILMLTARGDEQDRIIGLEMGADDYLAKPCNPRELLARIRAILRRAALKNTGTTPMQPLIIGDIELQSATRNILCNGVCISLTSTEFNILELLLKQVGTTTTKEFLSINVLGRNLTQHDRSMDMHVSNIRRKLGTYPNGEARIKTIRGIGYIYVPPNLTI